jgi:translation initiation factor IF-2
MAEDKMMRLSAVAKQINVGLSSIVDHLASVGFKVDLSPNTKLNFEQLSEVAKFYKKPELLLSDAAPIAPTEAQLKPVSVEEDTGIKFFRETKTETKLPEPEVIKEVVVEKPVEKPIEPEVEKPKEVITEVPPEVVPIISNEVESPVEPEKEAEIEVIRAEAKVGGLKVVGKIDLNPKPKPQERPAFKVQEKKEEPKKPEEPKVELPPKPEPKVELPKAPISKEVEEEEPVIELIEAKADALKGLTVLGKIVLPVEPVRSRDNNDKKKKRKRIDKPVGKVAAGKDEDTRGL